jgi:hypothetical protein
MPWATDLLPEEIDQNKEKVASIKKKKAIHWVGTIADGEFGNQTELFPFIKACRKNRVQWVHHNPWKKGVSAEENIQLIQESYLAPAIVGRWQKEKGYIPCRIFKNISYGQMGVTNSERVYELFDKKIVYNSDTYQLFFDAQQRVRSMRWEELSELMDMVRDHHTYINRIHTLLDFIDLLKIQTQRNKT